MKIGGMGGLEIVIILVVILLIFGPKNLPKLGRAFGKTISNLRSGMNEGKKKEGEDAPAAAEENQPEKPAVAQIEAVVEDEVPAGQPEQAADSASAEKEVIEDAEQAAAAAQAAVDEAPQPKKVKRVVKKKA